MEKYISDLVESGIPFHSSRLTYIEGFVGQGASSWHHYPLSASLLSSSLNGRWEESLLYSPFMKPVSLLGRVKWMTDPALFIASSRKQHKASA
jgi:hypothetical protein